MRQKLTLTAYLTRRGTCKALTRIEAEAFGIPYPLQSGWPARFAAMEITDAMLEDLATRIATAKQSTAGKARRGLEGVTPIVATSPVAQSQQAAQMPHSASSPAVAPSFPGFAVRATKRRQARRAAPWA